MLSVQPMRLIGIKLFSILLIMGVAFPALSWGVKGHQTVADVAYQLLPDDTRQRVDRLLKSAGFSDLAEAAVWPDEVKKTEAYRHTGSWHYVNVPKDATSVVLERDCQSICVVSAITNARKQLQDKSLSDAERGRALAFFSHFIGDVHQPLHVSYGYDRGGNDTRINLQGKSYSFHYYWDALVFNDDPDSQTLAAILLQQWRTEFEQQSWASSNELDWANESLQKTISLYHPLQTDVTRYTEDKRYAHKRLLQAGVRLAGQLAQILSDSSR